MHPYFETKSKKIFISHKTQSYHFPSHFHHYLELAFCRSGMQHIKVGEQLYTLKEGDVLVIFPNTVHEYVICHGPWEESTEVIAVICDTRLLAETLPEILTQYPKNPFLEGRFLCESTPLAFEKITAENNEAGLIGWTYIILSDLLNRLTLEPIQGSLELPAKIIAYVDANFHENLTISHLSRVFGYHPSYVAHLFSDRLKIPFRTYLGTVRSEYAATLIRTTGKSLTEIAYESGYQSLNTFCRCFKRHFQKTPSEYKKTYTTSEPKLR